MSLRIRTALPADAPTIHRFIVGLAKYEKEPDAVEVTPAELEEQLASDRPPFECLLAERDGTALGFALYFSNYSTWRGRAGLFLEDLFVPPEHRGQGVGRALVERVAQLTVERGGARLEWAVLDWNEPAMRFYRKMGAQSLDGWTTWRLTDDALRSPGSADSGRSAPPPR